MRADDFAKLREDLERELLNGAHYVGILGLTDVSLRLLDSLAVSGFIDAIDGIFTMSAEELPVTRCGCGLHRWSAYSTPGMTC